MNQKYTVIWNDKAIGEVSNLSIDMWYIDGTWSSNGSDLSKQFVIAIEAYDPVDFQKDPSNALRIRLKAEDGRVLYCLAILLEESILSLRQLISDDALNTFFS